MKLKLFWNCSSCQASGTVDGLGEMYEMCPKYGRHHGEVDSICEMTKEEFVEALSKSDDIAKYAHAIWICAEQLAEEAR